MKRPSFQFYPSDWLRDTALRSCSTGARGLWIDMICFMHEGNPYGYLKVGNKVILADNLARMVGLTTHEVEGYLAELKEAGVYDLDADGTICSRRMIRDENLRNIRASGGKLGGNPALMGKSKVNLKDKHKVENEVNQNPTPSSSSSSSSSNSKEVARGTRLPTDWVLPEDYREYCSTKRPDLDPELTAEQFKNYWNAKAGKDAVKLDWSATWRNWVINQKTFAQAKPSVKTILLSGGY
jgi:hypothetical protein